MDCGRQTDLQRGHQRDPGAEPIRWFAAAGGKDIAVEKDFNTTADNSGKISISFTTTTDNAEINGIDILPLAAPLTAGAAVINGGAAQRLMVTSISYTFNNAINPDSVNLADISLTREHSSAGTITLGYTLSNNNQTITFTWSGSGTLGGSLNDGIYDLLINTGAIMDVYGQSLSSAVPLNFWRLYGDY